MKLTFRLRYRTEFGQSLYIIGDHPLLGSGDRDKAVPLQFFSEESWQVSLDWPAGAREHISYDYLLKNTDGSSVQDWGRERALVPAESDGSELLVIDSWNYVGAPENAYYTEPFQKIFLAKNFTEVRVVAPADATHTFRIKAPLLPKGQTLCLCGDGSALGNWDMAKPILLSRRAGESDFMVRLDLRGQKFPLGYKYGVYDVGKNFFVRFEDGANRLLDASMASAGHAIISDGFIRLPFEPWRGAGVAIPVFSLRSEQSFGIGEFLDLKSFADWGRDVGLKLIQILPVNDTTATYTRADSYPYAAISAFALHPIYINLAAVADTANKKSLDALEPQRRQLNALDAVDYEAIIKAKVGFLKQIFPSQKASTFSRQEYKSFFKENETWLVPYAAFCFLRDKFDTSDFSRWSEHQHYDAGKIAALAKDTDGIAFHFFVQFHLHQQLREATDYARANGLIVKGDIAIGVSRDGSDVWQEPELFHADMQAGAPPDAFAAKGQNWSFPTYNWPRMQADGFAWWKRRFIQMRHYFDAFRIDHILGFFRIWSIPADAIEGILGHFVPALPVKKTEFAACGIAFEKERFTQPFINDAVLREIFGDKATTIKRSFLDARSDGSYSLKPEFATQRQIESHFAVQTQRDAKIEIGLFDLVSNVILLEVEGQLHFRLGMEDTASFKAFPRETQAKLCQLYEDYFYHRQDDFWKGEGMRKLPALKRVTNMLVCGEDLGMVPACVPVVMKELGLLSLEVQRMPKKLGHGFSRPAEAPYLSVVTPSTHDMSTIRGWWREEPANTQKFFQKELNLPGTAPSDAGPEIVQAVIRQHLESPAMWSIFQWQDLLGMDERLRRPDIEAERINIPADPRHYWRYRMHLTLEQLRQAKDFNAELHRSVQQSGR